MQKDDLRSPKSNWSSNEPVKQSRMNSCLFSKSWFWTYAVFFTLGAQIYQAVGSPCNTVSNPQLLAAFSAGLVGLMFYGTLSLAKRILSKPSSARQMPIMADYLRKTNVTIAELEATENSALAPGSKDN